jgi:hypothetical protein
MEWDVYPRSVKICHGNVLNVITVGDYVTFEGLKVAGVLLTDIIGNEKGPVGITYLPYIDREDRWAAYKYTLRGDSRFLICRPHGIEHFGQHIAWETLEKVEEPTSEIFKAKVVEVKAWFQDKITRVED